MDSAAGCLIQIVIVLAVICAVVMAIALAAAATMTCGSIYGIYKAMVCYATALRRTYGVDPSYEAGGGIKTLAGLIAGFIIMFVLGELGFIAPF